MSYQIHVNKYNLHFLQIYINKIIVMEQQKQQVSKGSLLKTYSQSWKEFFDRAMEILVQNPVKSRYVVKYNSKKHMFILKVTNGSITVMRKFQKFTKLAARVLSNQSDKKAQDTQQQGSKDPKKKKNKKKR